MDEGFEKIFEKKWAIVGFNRCRAIDIMLGIEKTCGKTVYKKFNNKHELRTEFADGTTLKWVSASESSRGFKFGKMWCDEKIDKDIFKLIIMPCYTGKYEDIIWV